MSNPFDFSDFSSTAAPLVASGGSAPSGFSDHPQAGRNTLLQTGFDPFGSSQPAQASSRKAFADVASESREGIHVARPPLVLFALTLALAGAAIVMSALWGRELTAAAVGWLLAGPAAIGVLSAYTRIDTRRRTEAVYSAPRWARALYWMSMIACLSGTAVAAWHLALWAGGQ
jgi:hypothetical protein